MPIGIYKRNKKDLERLRQTQFKKGIIPWNKGKHLTKKSKDKIRETIKERIKEGKIEGGIKTQFKKGHTLINGGFFGNKHSKESIEKMKKSMPDKSGDKNPFYKKQHTKETRRKMKEFWNNPEQKKLCRERRANQKNVFTSSIEVKIQTFLKQLEIEFFTHKYIKEIEHSYR